jgi:hypothetical protein
MIPLFIAVWLGLAGTGDRPRPAPAPAPPRLRVEPAGRVDLGEAGPLEARTQAYRFLNLSRAPIALRVLDRSPGITLAGPALERPIPPGGAAAVLLRLDPAGRTGPVLGNVRLATDDSRQGNYYLPVRVRIRPDLALDSPRRSFGDVGAHESPEVAYDLSRETGKPLAVRLASALPDYLECDLEADGPRVRAAFTLRPARIPAGMALGLERVRLATNVPGQEVLDLCLDWRVHHPVEPEPARVVFTDPRPAALELRLRSRAGVPFRILRADLEGEGFQAGPLPGAEAVEQLLVIRRTAAGPARAVLVLRCSGMAEPLRVPVAYLPAGPPE